MSYPDYSDKEYPNILNKSEFKNNASYAKKTYLYQDPSQMLLRNYISQSTVYDSVLLYQSLGSGKTCSSISIAEGFKEYVHNVGRKIVVLVKNKNLQKNFLNELLSKCSANEYLTDAEREIYFGMGNNGTGVEKAYNLQMKKEISNKVLRLISKSYMFITYGTFVNRVLGAKVFEKDDLGRKTNTVKRVNGDIQRKQPNDAIPNLNNTVVIVDEAHNITNNDIYTALHKVLSMSFNFRVVLLTATPMYDNPKEIFELSNILNASNYKLQLPIRNDLLNNVEYGEVLTKKKNSALISNDVLKGGIVHITQTGINKLQESLKGKVSYIQANVDTNPLRNDVGHDLIPKRIGTSTVVYCQMSQYQYSTYLEALKSDVKSDSRQDLSSAIQDLESAENIEEDVTISRTGSLYKNSSDASTFAYPNKLYGKEGFGSVFECNKKACTLLSEYKGILGINADLRKFSTKLFKLVKNVIASPGNVFIYSNYVSYGGTSLIKQVLLANGFTEYSGTQKKNTFVMFDQSNSVETRERQRRLFNSPENKHGDFIKVFIGSPIISEGVTLKNVRQVHILEPSWNMSKINQIIGRAIRNYSHHDLEPSERKVDVFKYVSVYYPKGETSTKGGLHKFFIDREKYVLSEEKDRANKKVERVLKELSFDCSLMEQRNFISEAFDGTAKCDYQSCAYKCLYKPLDKQTDNSTYDLNIQFIDKFDIEFLLSFLQNMFKMSFVWKLDDIIELVHKQEPYISKEAIFTTLGRIVSNKTFFTDMYNRNGYIINRGDYYIFNSSDIDIHSSLYSKMLDFTVEKSKYTLDAYFQKTFDRPLVTVEKQKKTTTLNTPNISQEDEAFNYNIINTHSIYGTFRSRGTKTNPFGNIDNVFRLVDQRNKSNNDDKRKMKTGQAMKSFTLDYLVEITQFLKIKLKTKISDYDVNGLSDTIKKHLIRNNLVLK